MVSQQNWLWPLPQILLWTGVTIGHDSGIFGFQVSWDKACVFQCMLSDSRAHCCLRGRQVFSGEFLFPASCTTGYALSGLVLGTGAVIRQGPPENLHMFWGP